MTAPGANRHDCYFVFAVNAPQYEQGAVWMFASRRQQRESFGLYLLWLHTDLWLVRDSDIDE